MAAARRKLQAFQQVEAVQEQSIRGANLSDVEGAPDTTKHARYEIVGTEAAGDNHGGRRVKGIPLANEPRILKPAGSH